MRRITYNDGNQAPVVESAIASPNAGTVPLVVWLNATASDGENESLAYTWVVAGNRVTGSANQR